MGPDWACLPALALNLILDNLVERMDHVWFSAVCKNWCSVPKLSHQDREFRSKVLPMLMISTKMKSRTERSLYGIPTGRAYHFELPVPCSRRCCGSSHGWLATVDPYNVITLLNPFKNETPIHLPLLKLGDSYRFFNDRNVYKVTLSADPTACPDDYVVAAIYGVCCRLAFIKGGQEFWTSVDDEFVCFSDITFYKDLIYAVGQWNNIVCFDLCYSNDPSGNDEIVPNILSPVDHDDAFSERAYLVKSLEGDMWMVTRFLGYHRDVKVDSGSTKSFEVCTLELDVQGRKLLHKLRLECSLCRLQ